MGVGTIKTTANLLETSIFPFDAMLLPIIPWFYAGFELVLTRKMSFYVVTYYLPSGLFVIVSWIRDHQIIDQLNNNSKMGLGVAHGPNIFI
jgi:hypothetical protein